MSKLTNWPFTEEDTLKPRIGVAAGLVAYIFQFLLPFFGATGKLVLTLFIILALALVCFAILRLLIPKMDPRDPEADRFVVWGGALLFVFIGIEGFGAWFVPGLIGGGALIWWRVPELVEVFPWFEEKGAIDVDTVENPDNRGHVDMHDDRFRLRK